MESSKAAKDQIKEKSGQFMNREGIGNRCKEKVPRLWRQYKCLMIGCYWMIALVKKGNNLKIK